MTAATPVSVCVELRDKATHESFVNYLLRLGCTVNDLGEGRFEVSVTYPETVDDEADAITAWCAVWSQAHAPSRADVHPQGSVTKAVALR